MNTISIRDKKIGKIEKNMELMLKKSVYEWGRMKWMQRKGKYGRMFLSVPGRSVGEHGKTLILHHINASYFQLKSALKVMVFKSTSENEMWNSH